MSNVININLLQQIGACKPHCDILRTIYPDGELVFDMAHLPEVLDKQVQVFWAVLLLAPEAQIALALKWYDRALASASPIWKTALRAIVASPEASAASAQLGERLADRRTTAASDVTATAVAGVGYAAAAFAVKFVETPPEQERVLGAMMVLSQWTARAASLSEAKTYDEILDELRADVWSAVETNGVTLPPT